MLQHQITQSPARLGLSNPTSPSLPAPTSNPSPNPNASPLAPPKLNTTAAAAATTTSSTLLSLLPPLPRAQALLLHMSSLASKFFEVSPNRSLWLSAFRGTLPSFLSSQSQTQSPILLEASPSSIKEILSLFTSLQTQLFKAVAELQEILDLQDAKNRISREIRSKDTALVAFANKLKDAEQLLDVLVDDYEDYRRPKRLKSDAVDGDEDGSSAAATTTTTVASRLNLSDIVSYAHRISYTTFAPPEFGAGQAPLRGALPPAPQDEQMRASQLYNVADIDVGLPKLGVEDKERAIESMVEPLADTNLGAIQGLLPPNITVPSGWKPGMPVELPTDLPVPPPGWKPGDPITLPPLEAIPARRPEEPQFPPLAAVPQGLPKEPETIQVRHVNLDLPDNFDDSSDYSSDEASSEDDD